MFSRPTQAPKLLAALALGGLAAVSPADAADVKTVSGSVCAPIVAGSDLWVRVGPGAYNLGSSNVLVVCPLVRDNTGNTNGLSDIEMQVSLPSSSSMTCTAGSYHPSGFATVESIAKTTQVAGNSKIDWGSSLNNSVSNGIYAIYCDVPPSGTIYSIRHKEP